MYCVIFEFGYVGIVDDYVDDWDCVGQLFLVGFVVDVQWVELVFDCGGGGGVCDCVDVGEDDDCVFVVEVCCDGVVDVMCGVGDDVCFGL